MATTKTWNEIRKAADAAGFYHGWMGAEENAATTIYEEKAAAPEDFDRIALGSLRDAMASGSLDKAEQDFFVSIGVEF